MKEIATKVGIVIVVVVVAATEVEHLAGEFDLAYILHHYYPLPSFPLLRHMTLVSLDVSEVKDFDSIGYAKPVFD